MTTINQLYRCVHNLKQVSVRFLYLVVFVNSRVETGNWLSQIK